MVDSRCGLHCTGCEWKESHGCGGCIETSGHPFHGECPVAQCSINKGISHCGECPQIPCELLTQYSCDPEHGDKPEGARIEQCKEWAKENRNMNETIKTILNRRSYRGYKPEQIGSEKLSAIIDCGLNAPSAMNTQNWHFTVIQNKDLIDWLNTEAKKTLPESAKERMITRGGENFSLFYNAPTVVLVSAQKDEKYCAINCSLATQNMCLAAESLNIGSCIIGLVTPLFDTEKSDEYIKELGIPDGYKPLYAVCFGYKGMEMQKPERMANR